MMACSGTGWAETTFPIPTDERPKHILAFSVRAPFIARSCSTIADACPVSSKGHGDSHNVRLLAELCGCVVELHRCWQRFPDVTKPRCGQLQHALLHIKHNVSHACNKQHEAQRNYLSLTNKRTTKRQQGTQAPAVARTGDARQLDLHYNVVASE